MRVKLLLNKNSWVRAYKNYFVDTLLVNSNDVEVVYDHEDLQAADVCFIIGYTKLVPVSVLSKFNYNLLVHESDLPKGKGGSPMSWQILEGSNNIVFSLINVNESIDSGDIWLKKEIVLNGSELCEEWRDIQAKSTIELCKQFLLEFDLLKPNKQVGSESIYPLRNSNDSELDINKTIYEQFNLLRVVDNERYPAFFFKEGIKYIVKINKESDE